MSTSDCPIVLNPDIAGIGIRLSLYISALVGPIVAAFVQSDELFKSVETALGVTGLAVLLTAFVSAGQGTLNLFDVLCVLHLVGLTGFSLQPSRKHARSEVRQRLAIGLYYMGMLGFCIFVIIVFTTAHRFGPNPQCNVRTLYVLFGFGVSATNYEFRWLFITVVILALVGILMTLGHGPGVAYFKDWLKLSGRPGYSRLLGDLAGRAYIVAMLEIIIRRNHVETDGSRWSFGQILAMMMLIGPLIEIISSFTSSESKSSESDIGIVDTISLSEAGTLQLVLLHSGRSILDLAFNAAAGAAAAATGAHVSGGALTGEIVRLGALAGVIGSGILNFCLLVSMTASNRVSVIMMLVTSTFGMAFVVILAISQKTIATTPDSLLIAALAAGAPLMAGTVVSWSKSILPLAVPFDALAGYTFARVAHTHGYDICSYNTAAAAGAVFSVLLWIFRLLSQCGSICTEKEQHQQVTEHYSTTLLPTGWLGSPGVAQVSHSSIVRYVRTVRTTHF